MDDPRDRDYARAPELDDLVRLCSALNEQGARYVLIGGFAVILHGYVRGTKDIDLLVDASPGNVQVVKAAMAVLADNAAELVGDEDLAKYQVVRVADEIVVDLLAHACDVDYEMARTQVQVFRIKGVEIPVASKRLLIRTKQTPRPSDQADIAFLVAGIEADEGR